MFGAARRSRFRVILRRYSFRDNRELQLCVSIAESVVTATAQETGAGFARHCRRAAIAQWFWAFEIYSTGCSDLRNVSLWADAFLSGKLTNLIFRLIFV